MTSNWIDHGHGEPADRLDVVFDGPSTGPGPRGAVGVRQLLRGTPSRPGSRAPRRTMALAAWTVVLGVTGGGAWAVRETLFPEGGQATAVSVWQNPGRIPPTSASATTTSTSTTSTTTSTTPSGIPSASSTSIDDHGGPGPSGDDGAGDRRGPNATPTSIDDHGHDGDAGATPTTIDDHGHDGAGVGTATTIDDHGGRGGDDGSSVSGPGGSGSGDDGSSGDG